MPITVKSIFQGEIRIANKTDVAVGENIDWFISKYEIRYLQMLFGVDFTDLFLAGISGDNPNPVMVALNTDDLKTAIASYIYAWYQRNEETTTQGVGTVKSALQNATLVSAGQKVTKAWNDMVCLSFKTLKFITDNYTDYPTFDFPNWYMALYARWQNSNFDNSFFLQPWYLGYYTCYLIPEIFIPMNRMGV